MTATRPQRIDQVLVDRGQARSRRIATELIRTGRVRLDGTVVHKPATPVHPGQSLRVDGPREAWVGRAAHKLLAALEHFPDIDPAGLRCLDVGASTGGFTQVLLARGAARVVAVDVGHGQLADLVRDDPRVEERSGLNIRDVVAAPSETPDRVALEPAPLVVCDLSFISLTLVLPVLGELTTPAGHLVALVKPQFEVGRHRLGHGGVVRDPAHRREAVGAVLTTVDRSGMHVHGLATSPITGSAGNREYLLWARHTPAGKMADVQTFLETIGGGP